MRTIAGLLAALFVAVLVWYLKEYMLSKIYGHWSYSFYWSFKAGVIWKVIIQWFLLCEVVFGILLLVVMSRFPRLRWGAYVIAGIAVAFWVRYLTSVFDSWEMDQHPMGPIDPFFESAPLKLGTDAAMGAASGLVYWMVARKSFTRRNRSGSAQPESRNYLAPMS
jgi:hypothetical protein